MTVTPPVNDDAARTAMLTGSPLGSAVLDWLTFMDRVISFNGLIHLSVAALRPTMTVTALIGSLLNKLDDEQKAAANKNIALASHEIDSDFELVHALTLIGAWGSFEAFIEDLCKAMLLMNRPLLASKSFEGVKVPATVLGGDPFEQIDIVFSEAAKKLNSDLKVGVGKFECLLELAGLDGNGDISDELRDAIYYAQQTRNVWAHRSGKADRRFVERCPKLGLSVGDTVKISTEQNDAYLRALMVYGVLVINRILGIHQFKPMPFPGDEHTPFADPYAKQWGTPPRGQPVTGWWAESSPQGDRESHTGDGPAATNIDD